MKPLKLGEMELFPLNKVLVFIARRRLVLIETENKLLLNGGK